MDHRGVLSVNGVDGTAALNAAIQVCLRGVLQTVKPTTQSNASADTGGNMPTPDVAMQLPRSSDAINEFSDNDTALYGVFWYEFLLCKGLGTAGSVDLASRRHLLLQYTGQFARNQECIFLLANQTQRHMYARAVNAQVKSNERAIDGFKQLIHDDAFFPDLEKGITNPRGKEAARVLHRIQPLWFMQRKGSIFCCGKKCGYHEAL